MNDQNRQVISLAITGASGVQYGFRLLEIACRQLMRRERQELFHGCVDVEKFCHKTKGFSGRPLKTLAKSALKPDWKS